MTGNFVGLAVVVLCIPWVAQDVRAADPVPAADPAAAGGASQAEKPSGAMPDANNTVRNVRDRDETVTPMDQGKSAADRTTTQKIRKAVVGHKGLSTDAKNVKIVTRDGVVTLRGPVKSEVEKAEIETLAKKAGVKRINNQIEVEAQR